MDDIYKVSRFIVFTVIFRRFFSLHHPPHCVGVSMVKGPLPGKFSTFLYTSCFWSKSCVENPLIGNGKKK